jgi:hypothetical protein
VVKPSPQIETKARSPFRLNLEAHVRRGPTGISRVSLHPPWRQSQRLRKVAYRFMPTSLGPHPLHQAPSLARPSHTSSRPKLRLSRTMLLKSNKHWPVHKRLTPCKSLLVCDMDLLTCGLDLPLVVQQPPYNFNLQEDRKLRPKKPKRKL